MNTKSKSAIRVVALVAVTLAFLGVAEICGAQTATSSTTDTSEVDAAARPGSVPLRKSEAVAAISENNHLILLPWYNLGTAPQGPWVPGYMKLVTPIVSTEGNMFSIKVKGYRYGTNGTPVEIRCGGYAYSSGLISTGCDTEGTGDPVGIGVDANSKVIITIGSGGSSWYYDHFTAEYSGWNAKDPNDFSWQFVYNTPPPTTNTNNVIVNDAAGTITTTSTTQSPTFRLPNGFELQQGANNYAQFNSWVHLNGYYGLYSAANGAHIYPNDGVYGAWRIQGTRNGYGGINYNNKTVLMMQDDLIGLFNEYQGRWILYGYGSTGNTIISPNGGNVGIGTTGPVERLEVSGNLKVSANGSLPGNITAAGTIEAGNIKAKYQDVAEWVPASEQLATGTVVVLDSTKSNQVTSSTVSYDTRVAGVVSELPGIALGEKSDGKVLVATTGRVRVKVDATRSPIQVGDLLVTSDVPGVAMKSQPVNLGGVQIHRPGTLIGKALEPLAKGKGEILVLLSLQ